eukprot:5503889-Pleurochrysis_carterae.AAC.1
MAATAPRARRRHGRRSTWWPRATKRSSERRSSRSERDRGDTFSVRRFESVSHVPNAPSYAMLFHGMLQVPCSQ